MTAVATYRHWLPIFCQCFRNLNSYRDRLSCYPTRTYRAWTLLTWLAFKQYNSWTDPFRKRSTSLYVRWTYKARFSPKLSSQNTIFCHRRASNVAFSSPVSTVYAWNAWDHDSLLATNNGLHFIGRSGSEISSTLSFEPNLGKEILRKMAQ